jgi:SAM-dependent methyltransferase
MHTDVNDLDAFYASPLGQVVRRLIGRIMRARWDNCAGLSLLGYGYCGPYLERFRDEARRTLALMPAQQGVIPWPSTARSSSALVIGEMLPLPDACIDRALVAHGLETAEDPGEVLEEICRVLAPEGRALLIVPSRRGVWARVDGTPFGQGQPFSKTQLRELIRETVFSPVYWGEALYLPPFTSRFMIRSAPAIERVGSALGLPFAGVHVVEAIKQVYRPVSVRRVQRSPAVSLRPAFAPTAQRDF